MEAIDRLNDICEEVGVCPGEPSDHELLVHFAVESLASPALIRDEARARATPCTCFKWRARDYCYSKGAIGLLKPEQADVYCVVGRVYEAKPRLKDRFTKFAEAAEEAHRKIEPLPKGERLIPWLEAMSIELGKRGISV